MAEGGSLTQYKERLRRQGASDEEVRQVSEILLQLEFERANGSSPLIQQIERLGPWALIFLGPALAVFLWSYLDGYYIISTLPLALFFIGLQQLNAR